jgi:MurNAc alpha-1-phosphate uridylyltransferase
MIAMILAAGRGERLRPVTDTMPKPLVEVGGVSLLERHLTALAKRGVSTVIINLGWLGEQIAERIGSGSRFGLQVCYSPEYDQILETGGGIRRALPMLGREPFWVLNSDTYTDFLIPDLALADDCLGHLVLVPTPKDKLNGDFDLVDGKIRNADEPRYTFSGFACYRPEFFAGKAVERFSVVPLLRKAADLGQLSGEIYAGRWVDIGTPQKLSDINNAS